MSQESTARQDRVIRWLTAAGIYYMVMIALYIDMGEDMGAGYFMPIALPILAGLVLLQYGTRLPLFSLATLPNLLTGFAWCMTFPLVYAWTFQSVWYQSKICFDFIVGTSGFLLLSSLAAVLFRLEYPRITAACLALLNFFGLLIPFIQMAYYCLFWHSLSPASLMAIYLTNWHESIDFVRSNVGDLQAILILAVTALVLYGFYRCHLRFYRRLIAQDTTPGRTLALTAMLAVTLIAEFWYVPQTSIADIWHNVRDYVAETQSYSLNYEERFNSMIVDETETLAAKAPGTVIYVIGESASRNYMKAFTPDFQYDDTPWLSGHVEDPNFVLFHNVYSSWTQTVPTLQRALTEQSQYNDKEFYESASIIDAAKKAGYETWWFSNQGRYGQFDSAITLVAKTADHAEWTDDTYDLSTKYDESLLPYLTQIDPTKNNFIVIHVMGSHIYYNSRYPESFNKFQTEEGESTASSLASYSNSILYTDYVLSQIFTYAQKNLNLRAMVYCSDHGENLKISHNPDIFMFDMVRIPMFVYLSPEYQQALPARTAALRSHQDRYFTNDMLYDTICGILNAPSNRYDPKQDFASRHYAFTRENLTTMLGQHSLTEDPDGLPENVQP